MLRPEALRQDAETEVDAAAAQEQGADEEDAREEDADRGVRAVREVLVDGARALVLAGEQGDGVGDGEHAQSRDQHAQRGVERGAVIRIGNKTEDESGREHGADGQGLRDGGHGAEPPFAQTPAIGGRR